jgi:hypothetical protein
VEVEKETPPHQTAQNVPPLDLIGGIPPDLELTIGTAKVAIQNLSMNLTACDSTENVVDFISLLDICGCSLGKPFLKNIQTRTFNKMVVGARN